MGTESPNEERALPDHRGAPEAAGAWRVTRRTGMTWSEESLEKCLKNPREFIHGEEMTFAGLSYFRLMFWDHRSCFKFNFSRTVEQVGDENHAHGREMLSHESSPNSA